MLLKPMQILTQVLKVLKARFVIDSIPKLFLKLRKTKKEGLYKNLPYKIFWNKNANLIKWNFSFSRYCEHLSLQYFPINHCLYNFCVYMKIMLFFRGFLQNYFSRMWNFGSKYLRTFTISTNKINNFQPRSQKATQCAFWFMNLFTWMSLIDSIFTLFMVSLLFLPHKNILGSSRDDCDGVPSAKRLKSNLDLYNTNLDDSLARMCHSQPAPSITTDDNPQDPTNLEARNDYCFSQPADLSDLLICTQLNATQSTQQSNSNPFQRLVKRMTRFFVTTKCDETIKRLTSVLDKFGWKWKLNDDSTVTISTTDRRKFQLIFKANLIDMDGKILLDFRLSKGCGLDFKRNFVKIRESKDIADTILNIPMNFSLATSVV